MFIYKCFKIRKFERGFYFRDNEFVEILNPGKHRFFDPFNKVRVDVRSVRDVWIHSKDLDVIAASGALEGQAEVIDLKDQEKALVWVNGRFDSILSQGLYAIWTLFNKVRIEVIDAKDGSFEHEALQVILKSDGAESFIESYIVDPGYVGLYFSDGKYISTFEPGEYAFWKGESKVQVRPVDMRESVLDVSGQEIITSDKVSLRLNATVTYKISDPVKAELTVDNALQALYRESQMALRGVVGGVDLDMLLTEKDKIAKELELTLKNRASLFGIFVLSLGIKDIILPGEMRALMNKVTEAKKAAEAHLISRREETAAMRSQANTAKILETNPTLMKIRELEILEKVAGNSKLSVVLGEKGLAERITELL